MIPEQRPSDHRCGVLICDDRVEIREAVSMVVSAIPHLQVVGEAADGHSCVERVRDLRPDFVIMDVNMPGGGPTLAAQVRALAPLTYIMVYSANQLPDSRLRMISAGADEYVIKTGRLAALKAGLDHGFERWSARVSSG